MCSFRRLLFQRPLAFVISKHIHTVKRKCFNINGCRQFTRQYKRYFEYEKIFKIFLNKWIVKLPSIGIVGGVSSFKSVRAYCEEFSMEDIKEEKIDLKPIEIKEASDLTHTNLLRSAGRVCTDGAVLLLHRSTSACIDKSEQYRQSLHKVMDLLEYCITIVRDKNQHDELWQYVIAARSQMEANKQQLMDLKILFDYSCLTLENASMAAFISGAEFSASISQNLITSAKQELSSEENKNVSLENQYMTIVAEHVRALTGVQSSEASPEACDQKDNVNNANETQNQNDIFEKIPMGLSNSEGNTKNTIIEDQSMEKLNVEDKKDICNMDDKNIDENVIDIKGKMSENIETSWMSGFSEYVEYEDKEDEKVLSF